MRSIIILSLITSFSFAAKGQLSAHRTYELDSVVCFIPSKYIQNLDSIQCYLHRNGKTDEERVFLYFGYLSCYFRYDEERYNDFKAPYFSPQFTAQRRKGVCRDFSRVFEYLCKKSQLKVCIVVGKAPEQFWHTVKKKMHFMSNLINHEWNIVYFNKSWHLMDPTWTRIESTEKKTHWNTKKRKNETYLIKRFNRTYYDCVPEFMATNHKPIHPAFYLLETIPTYKTALKKEKKHKSFATSYNFGKTLDSIFSYEFPTLTRYFENGCLRYSNCSSIGSEYAYLLEQKEWKQARYFKSSLTYYDEAIAEMLRVTNYVKQYADLDYTLQFKAFESTMLEKKAKLKKQLEAQDKKVMKKSTKKI